jgi:DNA end-binding protein Ku
MQHLRYADELRSFSEVPLAPAEVKEPELRLAVQLIEQIATDQFKPEEYEDHVRQRTRDLIEKKIEGQDITATPQEAPKAQIIDLMEALKASLAAAKPDAKPAVKPEKAVAEPVSLAARKPARPSPRTVVETSEAANVTEMAEPRRKGSKR